MPELPEVETIVRGLSSALIGRTITAVRVDWPRSVATHSIDDLRAELVGQRIEGLRRRAKYLIVDLSGGSALLIHLRMTGQLSVVPADRPPGPYDRVTFDLDNGQQLCFSDRRKLGRLYLVPDADWVVGQLGPEPLSEAFTPAVLRQRLAGRSRQLKPLLLDQTFIAGVGNIYANEALWLAGLSPWRRSDTLNEAEVERLYQGIIVALKRGLAHGGATIDAYRQADGSMGSYQEEFLVHGRAGQPCPRCGTPIRRAVLGQRSAYYCPYCQM